MNLERYEYKISSDNLEYRFFSLGPKGRIEKIVRFQPFITNLGTFMNLGFGDWDENTQSMNDKVTSDNKDTDKILATVANIVIDFTDHFPEMEVIAGGGTPSRNRLYRMGINRQYAAISRSFQIFGVTKDNEIEPFIKEADYTGFIVQRKFYKRRH
jgi:hypothetical protein